MLEAKQNELAQYQARAEKLGGEVESLASSKDQVIATLKKAVAEVVIEELAPIRKEYEHLMSDVAELDRLLAIGADHAASISIPKVMDMKEKMGLILP